MPATDFEGYSHEQLLAMIASLDPETVRARAAQLAKAAKAINEIGESLKRHRVTGWEGEAAHAFQDWVSRAGSATLLLGRYGEVAGTWMTHAAQTMVEVRANTPGYDTEAAATLRATRRHPNDPDAAPLARTAHAKLTADRNQAVQQLTKLAQSYDTSTTQLTRAEIPTFPPPPGVFVPKGVRDDGSYLERSGSDLSRPAGSERSSLAASTSRRGVHGGRSPSDLGYRPESVIAQPLGSPLPEPTGLGSNASVNLDHVAARGEIEFQPDGLPVAPGLGGASGQSPSLSVPLPLQQAGGQEAAAIGSLHTMWPSVGVGKVSGVPAPSPRDTGIVGGRPLSIGGSSGGFPQGTVIGAEDAHAGAGRVVPGMTGGGFGLPHGTRGTPVSGRRIAMEAGGLVGGREAASGVQQFTQGGSGLVRNGAGVSVMGHGGMHSPALSGSRGNQRGSCPDYLTEDEETWQGSRRIVPPVID